MSFIGNLQSAHFFKIYFEVCIEVETDYGPGIVFVKTAFLFCDSGVPALTLWISKFWLNEYCVTEVVGSSFDDNSILTKIEQCWFTTELYEVAVLLGSI